jgi:hypothetical protein
VETPATAVTAASVTASATMTHRTGCHSYCKRNRHSGREKLLLHLNLLKPSQINGGDMDVVRSKDADDG